MTEEQLQFFKEISILQSSIVAVYKSESSNYNDIEELLNIVTYETICGLIELIDGVGDFKNRGDIINRLTGNKINEDIMLHDCCEEFLKY